MDISLGLTPEISPPPYMSSTTIRDPIQQHASAIRHECHLSCFICGNLYIKERDIGPHLVQRSEPYLVIICPCSHMAHILCLKNYGMDYICHICNYVYPSRKYVCFAQLISCACHMLSALSVVGLFFGLSRLGGALDELALGSEIGPRLDGDETWQDHEMQQIVEWLDIVHYSTGFAGEAMLGLVYIIGTSLVIGFDRTMIMISNVVHVNFDPMFRSENMPKQIRLICVPFCLFIFGVTLGTYLLFFSWIWSYSLHQLRNRILNVAIYTRKVDGVA